jgi:hypothetical protein
MGAMAFLILFFIGVALATAGGLLGVIDAFRVSPVWGLVSLLIPFALWVFWAKFWRTRQWTRNSLILSLAGILSSVVALPFLGNTLQQVALRREEPQPIEEIPAEPVPVPDPDAEVDTPTDEVFVEPLVPAAPQLAAIARADLIQSTDPDERVQQVTSSRPDPFGAVAVPPRPQVSPPPAAPTAPTAVGPGAPGTAAPTPGPGAAPGTGPGAAPGTTPPVATAPSPGTPAPPATPPAAPGATPPPLAPLPELPTAPLAQEVMVTGVVNIGGQNFAIVESPDEGTSRYVQAGQRIANGQVLVKRIETRGADPVVVFEQNGIEVSRAVGATPPTANESAPGSAT